MKFCNACGRGNPPESNACERCGADFGLGGNAEGGLAPETRVGGQRYEVSRHLGQGGMGSVYLASDTRLDREVAIKLLNRDLIGHPTARARMEREAKAMARLNHPNVVDIYDIMDHEGTLALVIEFVEGGALTKRLEAGALPWEAATALIDGVLSGLHAIHAVGLVHRDLKPDNVLMASADTPKITDLGVAHDSTGRGMTRQGARLGTPEYMSPEQIKGLTVDARTDVYACGVVLYELLTGSVPFVGESDFDTWKAHTDLAPDLDRIDSAVPAHLNEVVRRALQKDPNDRFSTAEAMREALVTEEDPAQDNEKEIEHAVLTALQHQAEQFSDTMRREKTKAFKAAAETYGKDKQAGETPTAKFSRLSAIIIALLIGTLSLVIYNWWQANSDLRQLNSFSMHIFQTECAEGTQNATWHQRRNSCFNLGQIYEHGLGVEPSQAIAHTFYEKACCDPAGKPASAACQRVRNSPVIQTLSCFPHFPEGSRE
jgi:serine/threonine protein kinase